MKYKIVFSNKFKKDYERIKKRGKNMDKLKEIVRKLALGEALDKKNMPHELKGKYAGVM